ncbi:hypothetical protein KSP39_PZI017887 [Platanthera zijinensis]|uniref:Uncharacterized protein n=1 Tax=Platanthera zijinensis TaxID=2320716 RepID=A0AAP0G022_9ASPA
MMLTGDHESSAWGVAKAMGISEVYSNLKPEDKLNQVKKSSRDTGKHYFSYYMKLIFNLFKIH